MMKSTDTTRHVPVRTCIGCRQKGPKATLLRIVVSDGVPVVDERKRLPGRGAYLCRRERCFLRADKRGGLPRAFRRTPLRGGASLADAWRRFDADPETRAGMTTSTLEGVRQR
ncbi:MAG: YlxR family protein [Pseudomonadota bacterium]